MHEAPIDDMIDEIYDLFDRAMWAKDQVGMTLAFKFAKAIIWELSTDIIIAILSITLPVKLMEARVEFANKALEIIKKREPENFSAILKGLI